MSGVRFTTDPQLALDPNEGEKIITEAAESDFGIHGRPVHRRRY
jgi:hypothetical protein